eukprot:TRINITY_DN2178_c0_g1_i1.p1 TRINITY_DN2178_c0_g1~~TRINITY_DN2178_c0_g1_i1.p1  ORF type:complete len:270 (+),score=32.28 TRINITY_DN2178_c0_g1_i1:274-1083(+)
MFFLLNALESIYQADTSGAYSYLWQSIPNLLVFLAFTFLLIFFAENHLHSQAERKHVLRIVLVLANALFAAVALALSIVAIWQYNDPNGTLALMQGVVGALLGSFVVMDVFTCTCMIVYGIRLSRYMAHFPVGSAREKLAASRRIRRHVIALGICFCVRAAMTLLEIIYIADLRLSPSGYVVGFWGSLPSLLVGQVGIVLPEACAVLTMLLWMRSRTTAVSAVNTLSQYYENPAPNATALLLDDESDHSSPRIKPQTPVISFQEIRKPL